MTPLHLRILGSLVRVVLAAAGGAAWVSDNDLEQLIGALGVLVTFGWSVYQKWHAARQVPA